MTYDYSALEVTILVMSQPLCLITYLLLDYAIEDVIILNKSGPGALPPCATFALFLLNDWLFSINVNSITENVIISFNLLFFIF